MPQLIQDPSEFLADGNVQSVPAVQDSDINDGDLLNDTRTIDLGNGYKFEITLPSGRVLESAPVGSDYPKRDAIMQWLGAVRGSIIEDSAAAARSARDRHLAEPVSTSQTGAAPAAAASESVFSAISDPVEYAKQQLRSALERLAALHSAESDVAKWQRVVDSLTGGSSFVANKPKRRKKRKVRKSVRANTGHQLATYDTGVAPLHAAYTPVAVEE